MTGKELLHSLQQMDSSELNYVVLIGVEGNWVRLESITKDFEMKTLDLSNPEFKGEDE